MDENRFQQIALAKSGGWQKGDNRFKRTSNRFLIKFVFTTEIFAEYDRILLAFGGVSYHF